MDNETLEEYAKIAMSQSKVQGTINVTMDTTVDTVLNTIPNIVVNAVDGKEGKEIAREALEDTGKSLASNAAGEVIAVGAKAAATGAKGIVEKILKKLDDAVKEGSEPGTLSNVDARKWYLEQEAKIPDLIDDSLPLEQQARQAFELRNQYRMQARELMSD